jgi:hypothetical protein
VAALLDDDQLRGGASPENADNSVPGPNSTRIWVLELERDTGNAQVGLDRRCGHRRGFLGGEAARRRQSSPESDAWAPRARQGLRDLAHGVKGDLGRLPRTRIGPEMACRAPALMQGGGVRVGARERVLQGSEQKGSGSGKIWASRRSRRAARPGLRRGGVAWPRRRGLCSGRSKSWRRREGLRGCSAAA